MHHIYNDTEMVRRLKYAYGRAGFLALRDFKELVARRERELLVWARDAGWAWANIASFLGVTPQAVYQRYKSLTAEDDESILDDAGENVTPLEDPPSRDPGRIA
jgi:hypothetical protein